MALVRCESFDHFTTQAQLTTKPGWTVSGTITIETTAGKRSTGNLRTAGSNGCTATLAIPAAHASGVANLAFSTDSLDGAQEWEYFSIESGATVHLVVVVDSVTGTIRVRRGFGGTLLATGTAIISINTYYHVQFKFTIDNTTGSFEMRLDGNPVADVSFSGDTQNGGSANWDRIRFHGQQLNANSPFIRFDDIVLLDGVDSTGTHGIANNDFIGETRVDCLIGETGNGANTDFTPSTGADHGALIDETTPNDDTDYNTGTTVGHRDTYTLPALGFVPVTIFGVQSVNRLKKTDAGPRSIANVLRSDGINYDGADQSLTTSYAFYTEVEESDPDTSAPWDPSAITALEVGVKVTV